MALIHVVIDGELQQIDESLLDRRDGVIENDVELTTWVEYRLKGQPESEPVHRSVAITLKQGVSIFGDVQGFS